MFAHPAGRTHLYCAERRRNECSPGASHCVPSARCHQQQQKYVIMRVLIYYYETKVQIVPCTTFCTARKWLWFKARHLRLMGKFLNSQISSQKLPWLITYSKTITFCIKFSELLCFLYANEQWLNVTKYIYSSRNLRYLHFTWVFPFSATLYFYSTTS